MVQLRHTGIYVYDLNLMESFYKKVFDMHVISSHIVQKDDLICDILKNNDAEVLISKLITEQGKINGTGDMLELVQVIGPSVKSSNSTRPMIWEQGIMHVAFGVCTVQKTAEKILKYGGSKVTEIHTMPNGNACGFFEDPEYNYIELIGKE